jgi:hypothetical protein
MHVEDSAAGGHRCIRYRGMIDMLLNHPSHLVQGLLPNKDEYQEVVNRGTSLETRNSSSMSSHRAGMSDCDLIKALLAAAARYKNDLPYSFPNISWVPGRTDGEMQPGQYNSNSYVAGLLAAVGVVLSNVNAGGDYQVPGFQKPIPLTH